MQLRIIGSGSSGNCYLLDNGKEALMIECGMRFDKVKESVGFDISRIKGALVSHEHQDHASSVQTCLLYAMQMFMSQGTADALNIADNHNVHILEEDKSCQIGGFTVQPFKVVHDAAQPFGFLIYHEECGLTLFATDTAYLHYTFPPLNNVMIECNYSYDMLQKNFENGTVSLSQRLRIVKSHLSLGRCMYILQSNDMSHVNNIVLLHMSDRNISAFEAKTCFEAWLNKTVTVASSGIDIPFNKSPF